MVNVIEPGGAVAKDGRIAVRDQIVMVRTPNRRKYFFMQRVNFLNTTLFRDKTFRLTFLFPNKNQSENS